MTKYAELTTKKAKVAHIKQMVATNDAWALRALSRIYEYQTTAEQTAGHTRDLNGVGFSGADSEILSSFADQLLRGRKMSEKQMVIIHRKMPKYARQLMRIADSA